MLFMLSWKDGEKPHVNFLPENDWVTAMRELTTAKDANRKIELWRAANNELKLVYPDAATAAVEGALVEK